MNKIDATVELGNRDLCRRDNHPSVFTVIKIRNGDKSDTSHIEYNKEVKITK
jgi:hypothetical protein